MKNCEINIRDPFVLVEDDTYYMYGTRAKDFGRFVGGVDVYTSKDLENWSEPVECFNAVEFDMNKEVVWAPEVHKYNGSYYMLVTLTDGMRGTYALRSESPLGPFKPHSNGKLTPIEWECLDGTLYIENDVAYLVFCHEHTQIYDGAMCYIQLSDDLTHSVGEPVTLFSASEPKWVKDKILFKHYITDGPFMFRTKDDVLIMIWSTFINNKYAECVVRFNDGTINGSLEHLKPLIDDDGGHGMIFNANGKIYLTYHTPNKTGSEHPAFIELVDNCDHLSKKI